MNALLRLLLRWLFGFRVFNEEVLKTKGPVLMLPNHVSWLDWMFLLALLAFGVVSLSHGRHRRGDHRATPAGPVARGRGWRL